MAPPPFLYPAPPMCMETPLLPTFALTVHRSGGKTSSSLLLLVWRMEENDAAMGAEFKAL